MTPMFPEDTARFLAALSSPNRQSIMMLFRDGKSLSVGEIATAVGLSMPTVSLHLRELRQGGLLTSVKKGKAVYYTADVASIRAQLGSLNAFLETCC